MQLAENIKLTLLRQLLLPALRYALSNSISSSQLIETVKDALVALAAQELSRTQKKITVSRISIMAGLNRRDVTRLWRGEQLEERPPSLVTRVLSQWENDPRFTTAAGKPKILGCKGTENEFRQLVESVTKDISPASMLFELERIRAVEKSPRGVRLLYPEHYFTTDPQRGLELLARDTSTLVQAVEDNLFSTERTKNLHLRTEYDNVFVDALPAVRDWLVNEGAAFHKRAREFF